MTYRLAAELGDRIAAIAPVAGGLNNSANNWSQIPQLPILDINGTSDPYRSWGFDWWSVTKTFDYWTQNNNCSLPADIILLPDINTEDNCTVEKKFLTNCSNNTSIIQYKIINGGHQWPGANEAFHTWDGGNLNQNINANVEMWNFFNGNIQQQALVYTKEIDSPVKISIYPNPAINQITIELELSKAMPLKVQLLNSMGQQVSSTDMEIVYAGPQKLEWQLQSNNIPNGLYFLVITLDRDQVLTKSIMFSAE